MAQRTLRYPVATNASTLTRRTTAGVLLAILAVLVTQAFVDALGVDLGATGEMSPFAAGPLVATTIVAGVGAALAYVVVVRYTANPVQNFLALAVTVFIIMLLPVLVVTPSLDVTLAGQGLLVLYHLLVAGSLVAFIVGAVDV